MPVVQTPTPGAGRSCRIVIDTCADFNREVAETLDVDIIPFPYVLDGVEHHDDIWASQTPKQFYDKLRKGSRGSTSAVPMGWFEEFFRACFEDGTPTVYLSFCSGLSSSYEAARAAAADVLTDEALRAAHPDFELHVVDNGLPCSAAELLALEAVRQRDRGLSAAQLAAWAEEVKPYIHGYFTLENLEHLAAGGRIPPAAAQLSAKLDVKPELTYDLKGALVLKGICRGRKKALKALVKDFRDNFAGDVEMPVGITSADAEKDADWLEAQIRREPGCENLNIIRGSVGPTLGVHVGPGMVAIVFWGKCRTERVSMSDRIARRVRGE